MSRRIAGRPRPRQPPSSKHRRPRWLLPQAPPEAPAPTSTESYDDLMRLKGLLDAGVLTQAEFDAQKQKILGA